MFNKAQLLQLLAQNEIEQVFVLLRENAQAEITLLEAQWESLKANKRTGVLTQEQTNVEEARIRRRILECIEQQERPLGASAAPPKGFGRLLPFVIGLVAVGMVVIFLIRPWGPGTTTKPPTGPDATPPATPSASSRQAPKQLTVPSEPIELTAEYVGTTGYQILSAEISARNPENNLLSIRLRCIRPPYGQSVSAATMHLLHGAEEKAPFEVIFPFVEAKTTGEGTLNFEVPKDWADAELMIYHGAVEPIKKAKIPLKF